MRRVGGYNLDEFVYTDRWNLAKLITGSEGTLGTILEARLNLEPVPKTNALLSRISLSCSKPSGPLNHAAF